MKPLLTLFILFLSGSCVAIGWQEVTKDESEKLGIELNIRYSSGEECFEISGSLPKTINFQELGNRTLASIYYVKVASKEEGWQIT